MDLATIVTDAAATAAAIGQRIAGIGLAWPHGEDAAALRLSWTDLGPDLRPLPVERIPSAASVTITGYNKPPATIRLLESQPSQQEILTLGWRLGAEMALRDQIRPLAPGEDPYDDAKGMTICFGGRAVYETALTGEMVWEIADGRTEWMIPLAAERGHVAWWMPIRCTDPPRSEPLPAHWLPEEPLRTLKYDGHRTFWPLHPRHHPRPRPTPRATPRQRDYLAALCARARALAPELAADTLARLPRLDRRAASAAIDALLARLDPPSAQGA